MRGAGNNGPDNHDLRRRRRAAELLAKAELFAGLDRVTLAKLAANLDPVVFRKGQAACKQGEPGDSLMVVIAGRTKLTNVSVSGKEVVLHFLGAGDIYGEIAALDGKERAANAVALEESQVFLLYTRDLIPALKAHPIAMFAIIQALCEKIRAGAAIIEDSTLEMRGRTARGLLRLARQHGRRDAEGVCLQLTISQEELGKYLGLSRANVSRQLGQLKEADVIKIGGAHIIITDEKGLAEIAEAAPRE